MTKPKTNLKRHWRAVVRFGLAHHPTCSEFAPDVVVAKLGRRSVPLCRGCIVFWPLLAAFVPILLAVASKDGVDWWLFCLIGAALGATQVASYTSATRRPAAKVLVKVAFAIGTAAFMTGLVLAPGPPALRIGVGLVLALVAAAVQSLRFRKIAAQCARCPWKKDWQFCPGFAPLNDHTQGRVPAAFAGSMQALPQPWPWPPRASTDERPA